MRWGTQGSSQVAAGNTEFHVSCDRYLRKPLELHKGSQTSFQVVRGNSGVLPRHYRGIGPLLELQCETRGFSHDAAGNGSLSRCDGKPSVPLELRWVTQSSS